MLIGLSFVYGIFHAAGPGHGKAVISSYMLANEVALRRGVMLSFVSAMLQAVTAVALMTLVFFALRGTAVSMTDAAWALEIASYVMVTRLRRLAVVAEACPRSLGQDTAAAQPVRARHAVGDDADHHRTQMRHHAARSYPFARPPHRGHAHDQRRRPHDGGLRAFAAMRMHPTQAGSAAMISSWRTAWSAVTAVGLRPCSGALIVLSFAFLNGLFAGGVLSVLAMALGTAITVSLLATLAVGAKNGALALAGGGRVGQRAFISPSRLPARPSCWRSGSCCSPPACRRRRAAPRRRGEDGYLRFWLRPRR